MATHKRYSDETVLKATGKSWKQWFSILDKAGMKAKPHQEVAKWLWDHYGDSKKTGNLSGWWCQGVTVEYEFHHGKRVVGQTKNSGFQIGVQRSLDAPADQVWKLITSPQGTKIWLGDIGELNPLAGYGYRTKDGTSGEIRTVDPGKKLRLSWKLPAQRQFSTLQIYLDCPRNTKNKTTVSFHHEKLASAKQREVMRQHWLDVLQNLESVIAK